MSLAASIRVMPPVALVSVGQPWMWVAFTALICLFLAIDLGVFNRRPHALGAREAAAWVAVWVMLALGFNLFVAHEFGRQSGLEFLTGYLIEEALSVDNLFVFVVLFDYFVVPPALKHRVLFWGILAALVMRGTFILLGAALLQRFEWILYIFGALLVITAVKLALQEESGVHPERNPILRLFRRFIPMTKDYEGSRFLVRRDRRLLATPLLMVLVIVNVMDLVFAIDSIPAVFAVTRDPFIIFTSNIFAVLGLRSLFFLLASVIDRFHYLRYGLALVLGFVGGKMLLNGWYHVSIGVSLGVVAGILGVSILVSFLLPPAHAEEQKKAAAREDARREKSWKRGRH
jgi:TerC family integral membrane protein